MHSYLITSAELCIIGMFAILFGTSSYITYQVVKHTRVSKFYDTFDSMKDKIYKGIIFGISAAITLLLGNIFLRRIESTLYKIF
jgi:hypothetical protein